jgi:hypothetical protein
VQGITKQVLGLKQKHRIIDSERLVEKRDQRNKGNDNRWDDGMPIPFKSHSQSGQSLF